MKRITKASPAALAIAGAPAIGLGIVATGGVLPVVDAAICVLLTANVDIIWQFYTVRIKKQGRSLVSCPLLRALSHNFLNLEENLK
jgi:hypothetical protein